MRVIFLSISLVILLAQACTISTTSGYHPETDRSSHVSEWIEDIDFYRSTLEEKHINLYHNMSKSDFIQELEQLKSSLPRLNKYQVMTELMRITRLVGDGHTLFSYRGTEYSRFPVYFQAFGNSFRVTKTTKELNYLLGSRLLSIEGVPIEQVSDRVNPVVQGIDNQYSLEHFLPMTMNVSEVLYGLGITESIKRATFEFSSDSGEITSMTIDAIESETLENETLQSLSAYSPHFQTTESSTDGMNLSLDEGNKAAYIKFDSYPGWLKMFRFSNRVNRILTNGNYRNLIIDLRNNGGGNFFEGLLLAQYLITIDNLDWENGIYVLIGNETFSAGVSNAALYRQMLNATLVGEPTGGNPYGYQDADSFRLPNSKWPVQYSKRLFKMQDTVTNGLQPDILIELEWDDYASGHDKQLNWVITNLNQNNAL